MATDPIDVKLNIIRTLREELLADVTLANNLLLELNRYLNQLRNRDPDMMNSQNLMSTRTNLMRTIAEKEQLLKNYRAITAVIIIETPRAQCFVNTENSSQREIRPIWNNVQRVNNQNQFVPTAVLTRTGKIPVNTARASGTKNVSTARHSFNRQAVLTSAAMKVNTVKPIDYPHRALQNKGIVDSGCSRHMTGNKAYLAEYQDFNGGPVAFGGSKGYISWWWNR
ncbi:hypothetical protein Tco_0859158 [Tanacetum coccineum]|uniref:Retrovirus-related Pol polyprotein from transposon TNT 1-94-like beta-barrel domain-containing protein n=1 Tax=Tanacetum coccineum TaxID=301880 RepID=A0ABQ5BBZ3_9ASTR